MQTVADFVQDEVAERVDTAAIVDSYNHLKQIVDRIKSGDEIVNDGFFRAWKSDGSDVDDGGSSDPLCRAVHYKCKKCPCDCSEQRTAYELNPNIRTATALMETRRVG